MKLNLGCGFNHLAGFVNIDNNPACKPDRLLNLERADPPLNEALDFAIPRWPDSGSVDEVAAHHVLEHVNNFTGLMQWLYRVMKPGALMDIRLPHPRSDLYIGDPTHVRPLTADSFALLSRKECARYREAGASNTPLADMLGVDFEIVSNEAMVSPEFRGQSRGEIQFAVRHFWNVIDELRIVVRRV